MEEVEVIQFTVYGEPVGKARPRVTRYGTYTPQKTRNYEQKIWDSWAEQSGKKLPDNAPIKLNVKVYFSVPKSYSKKLRDRLVGEPHIKLPDLDNCVKAICDGCQGYVFKNDSHIYCIEAVKFYSETPRTEITLEVMGNEKKT